jgi:hypothetical protein
MMAPQKSECPVAAGQIAKGSTEDAAIVAPVTTEGKGLATLKAQLAIAGHAVHELAGGGFVVIATRWAGMCRECPDLRALAAFARQIGAAR